jgi:peptidyl-prolyl cis-trans isomerase-like 1
MDKLKKLFKHDSSDSHSDSAAATHTQAAPSTTTSAQAPQSSNAAIPEKPAGVLMTTNYGDITIALYSDKVPKVRASSLSITRSSN